MAKQKYSEFADALDAAATLDGTEEVIVMQDGAPAKTTAQDIADLGGGGASYLKYVALLTQTGTDAPVATVLENTLGGTVVWARSEVGVYTATLADAFTANKTAVPNPGLAWDTSAKYANAQITDTDTITLYVTSEDGTTPVDGWTCPCFEIRVYP